MQLYEVKTWSEPGNTLSLTTRFVSSLKEANSLIKGVPRFIVNRATIKDRLTRGDLLFLLEGDAPGNQPQVMTPMDLIMDRVRVKENMP